MRRSGPPPTATTTPTTRAAAPRCPTCPTSGLIDTVRQTGRTVEYSTLGEPPPLPASVEMIVYRLVQEGLTNAVRYAGDGPIDVQVIYSPTAITVFVDDEGPGAAAADRASRWRRPRAGRDAGTAGRHRRDPGSRTPPARDRAGGCTPASRSCSSASPEQPSC